MKKARAENVTLKRERHGLLKVQKDQFYPAYYKNLSGGRK